MPEKLYSRRDLFKLGWNVAKVAAVIGVANNFPKILLPERAIAPAETSNPTLEAATSESIANPDFFKGIIAYQLDNSQYARMERVVDHNNTCGEATLATIENMLNKQDEVEVPKKIIADTFKALDGKTFTNEWGQPFPYFDKYELMPVEVLPGAIDILMPQFDLEKKFLTPLPFWSVADEKMEWNPIPLADWSYYLSKAQGICENGGFTIVVGEKHSWPHIMLATNVKSNGTATFVDTYTGTAEKAAFNDFLEVVDGQPALLAILGISRPPSTQNQNFNRGLLRQF
jgi:hypothetical protein